MFKPCCLKVLLSIFLIGSVYGKFEPERSEPSMAKAREVVTQYMNAVSGLGHFSGAVLVARDSEPILRGAYGMADIEEGVPNRVNTTYRIASLTKSFAAMAVLILQEKGKLRLEDRLSDYFPDGPETWRGITLENLLRHTSGIPDSEEALGGLDSETYASFRAEPDNLKRIVEKAFQSKLEFEPGTKFKYSNTGYLLIGHIIEKSSGRTLEDFLETEFFKPLGMSHTGQDRYDLTLPNPARGYQLKTGWTYREYLAGFKPDSGMLTPVPYMRMEVPNAAGGLYSTIDDLYRWSRALAKPGYFSGEVIGQMGTPGLEGYGLGWFADEYLGRKRFRHTGSLPGFNSVFLRFPEDGAVIIILGNTSQNTGRIADDLAAAIFGETVVVPEPHQIVDVPAPALKPLHGTYLRDDGRTYKVYQDEEMLVIAHADRFIAGMLPETERRFFVPMFRGNVTFLMDGKGEVTGLVAYIHGKKVTLDKKKSP